MHCTPLSSDTNIILQLIIMKKYKQKQAKFCYKLYKLTFQINSEGDTSQLRSLKIMQ